LFGKTNYEAKRRKRKRDDRGFIPALSEKKMLHRTGRKKEMLSWAIIIFITRKAKGLSSILLFLR